MNVSSLKRREFLAGMAAGAATLTLSSLSHAESVSRLSDSHDATSSIADLTFQSYQPIPELS